MKMRYKIAEDARPQIMLLLIATVITIALWFIPFADYLVYPIRLFVTFIHEGGHALAAVLTGGSVQSLTVAPDSSGLVKAYSDSSLATLIFSSAGYLSAMAYGVLLLALIRWNVSPYKILFGSGVFVAFLTVVFGFLSPIFHIFSGDISFFGMAFTIFSGALISVGLVAAARYANLKWANFAVAFLAVQCLLNAVFDLKNLFISTTTNAHNDAMNMAEVTGLPSALWILIWIGISILMISIGLRVYAVSQKGKQYDLPFEDK
jgi:hypothetical protein